MASHRQIRAGTLAPKRTTGSAGKCADAAGRVHGHIVTGDVTINQIFFFRALVARFFLHGIHVKEYLHIGVAAET